MSCTFDSKDISKEELAGWCRSLHQGDIKDKLDVLVKIRGAITLRSELPIDVLISESIIPDLINGLKCNNGKIQLECAWILGNIASGNEEQTREVMYSGVTPIFYEQLETTKDKTYMPVIIWCFGNLCGEEKCRNILLSGGLISKIVAILNKFYLNQEIMENCLFCLRNAFSVMRVTQPSHKTELRSILSIYEKILSTPANRLEIHTGILSDILQLCQAVIENNSTEIGATTLPVIIHCLSIMNTSVQASLQNIPEETPKYPTKQILEVLGNILSENDGYAVSLVNQGLIPFLNNVYIDPSNDDLLLKLEVIFCWMNLSGGSQSQILFDTGIINMLVGNVTNIGAQSDSINLEAAKRSLVVICNFLCECNDQTRFYLLQNNVKSLIEGYVSIVGGQATDEDSAFILNTLERMNNSLVC